MIDVFNSQEQEKFDEPHTVVEDFILLAYADVQNKSRNDLLGTTKDRKNIKIVQYSIKRNEFKPQIINFNRYIVHMIPCDFFNKKKNGSYLGLQKKSKLRSFF